MNLRPLSLIAGLLLLAACSQNPSTNANTGGAGAGNAGASQVVPGSAQDFQQNVGDRVFFDFDKSVVKPEGQQTLQRQAEWLKRYPNVTVTVEGHCDDRGTREYNLALGARRANVVMNYLISKGVSSGRLTMKSFGKERPVAICDNESCWSQNRRAVTVVQ